MKDLHSHILPGIDDGSKSINESIEILKKAEKQGVTDLIFTPHYMENTSYNKNNKEKRELFNELADKARDEDIKVKLYLGNEVYLTENFIELIKKKEIMTLNNSRYLLLEFPLGNIFQNTKDILYELIVAGCIPILAHPERYKIFQRHPDHIEEYLRMGVLLQGNYKSLFGKYGPDAKKTLKYYLKQGWISFLGSDCHHEGDFELKKLKRKLKSIVRDEDIVMDLLENNFDKVVNDLDMGIRR